MHILEAFCVLAVAFLCPDVEAGPIITMEYTIGLAMITMITKVNVEGAMVFSKNLIKMTVDYQSLFDEPEKYQVNCNGNCTNLEFYADADILVLASKEPVFDSDTGCFNCFCVWKKNNRFNPGCKNIGNLGSNTFYVYAFNYKGIMSANAKIKGRFKSIFRDYMSQWSDYPYDYKNGYGALPVSVIGPIDNYYYLSLEVFCKYKTKCTDVKIEILKDSHLSVKTVRAGKDTSLNGKGQCKDCDCKDRKSCEKRFNPTLNAAGNGFDYFKIDITFGSSTKRYPAYVRISGKNLRSYRDYSYY